MAILNINKDRKFMYISLNYVYLNQFSKKYIKINVTLLPNVLPLLKM